MKHLFIIFCAMCFFTFKTQAQDSWNCGLDGAPNIIATFFPLQQTLFISGKGEMGEGSPWANFRKAIKIVKIYQGVTTIGDKAFYGLTNLETVIIANSVTSIGSMAFEHTYKLRKIDIPNSVAYIGGGAFSHSGLESITLPYNVQDIGEYTFNECSSLKTADLSKTQLSKLYSKFFYKCEKLENVYLPSKMKLISEWTFAGCKSLKSITCYNSIPPQLPFWTFGREGQDERIDLGQVTLYVPEASISVYKDSDVWKEFGKIEAIPAR